MIELLPGNLKLSLKLLDGLQPCFPVSIVFQIIHQFFTHHLLHLFMTSQYRGTDITYWRKHQTCLSFKIIISFWVSDFLEVEGVLKFFMLMYSHWRFYFFHWGFLFFSFPVRRNLFFISVDHRDSFRFCFHEIGPLKGRVFCISFLFFFLGSGTLIFLIFLYFNFLLEKVEFDFI